MSRFVVLCTFALLTVNAQSQTFTISDTFSATIDQPNSRVAQISGSFSGMFSTPDVAAGERAVIFELFNFALNPSTIGGLTFDSSSSSGVAFFNADGSLFNIFVGGATGFISGTGDIVNTDLRHDWRVDYTRFDSGSLPLQIPSLISYAEDGTFFFGSDIMSNLQVTISNSGPGGPGPGVPSPVPLPAAAWLLLSAFSGLFGCRWLRRKRLVAPSICPSTCSI